MKKNTKIIFILIGIVVIILAFFIGKSILETSKLNEKKKIIATPDENLISEAKEKNKSLIAIYEITDKPNKLDVKIVIADDTKDEGKAIEVNEFYTFGKENKLSKKIIFSNIYAAELAKENDDYEGIKSELMDNVLVYEDQKITETKDAILKNIIDECEKNNLYYKINK